MQRSLIFILGLLSYCVCCYFTSSFFKHKPDKNFSAFWNFVRWIQTCLCNSLTPSL